MGYSPSSPGGIARFGVFELNLRSGELRKAGVRVTLQDQPLVILKALLECPGELVTREQLQQRLWPGDTFVDFEHGLNAAVKRLRAALSDDAERPRFVETLPRRGYRFIAPVDGTSAGAAGAEPLGQLRPTTANRAGEAAPRPLRRRRTDLLAGALLCVSAVIAFSAGVIRHRFSPPTSPVIQSLAVLPLDNLSGDPDQQYFTDGMTEALIANLGRIPTLRVISKTTAMQYREKRKPLPEIASELNVDAIVEGSVMRTGDRVRITAQLIQATPEGQLWTGSYERNLRDVAALQDEVASAVAREIRVKLGPAESPLGDVAPVDPAAYEAYLRGRFFWEQAMGAPSSASAGFQRSQRYLEQAIAVQPHFAPAHAWLAACHFAVAEQADVGVTRHDEGIRRARFHVARARELDPNLADGHLILAFLNTFEEGDWEAALRNFERAAELRPSDPIVRVNYAYVLLGRSRTEEAVHQANRALHLDPVSEKVTRDAARLLYFARRYDDAIEAYRRLGEINPHSGWASGMAHAYAMKGMAQEALVHGTEAVRLAPAAPESLHALGIVHALAGRRMEALDVMGELQKTGSAAWAMAEVHAAAGEKERAIVLLEEAVNSAPTPFHLSFELLDPVFDNLHDHPRFQRLMRRMTLLSPLLPHPGGSSVAAAR